MKVNASAMYGHSIYKSQFNPVKAPHFNNSTTSVIDADAIKVIRNKEITVSEAQAVSVEHTFKDAKNISDRNANTKLTKALDSTLQRVHKEIFSPTDNPTKFALAQTMHIDDFSTKVLKMVHYRDAFVENMQTLLSKGLDAQQNNIANKQAIMKKSVYA